MTADHGKFQQVYDLCREILWIRELRVTTEYQVMECDNHAENLVSVLDQIGLSGISYCFCNYIYPSGVGHACLRRLTLRTVLSPGSKNNSNNIRLYFSWH